MSGTNCRPPSPRIEFELTRFRLRNPIAGRDAVEASNSVRKRRVEDLVSFILVSCDAVVVFMLERVVRRRFSASGAFVDDVPAEAQ